MRGPGGFDNLLGKMAAKHGRGEASSARHEAAKGLIDAIHARDPQQFLEWRDRLADHDADPEHDTVYEDHEGEDPSDAASEEN